MKKSILLLLIMLCFSVLGFAQKTVTGVVTDNNGEQMPGVTIVVKNTTDGTVTRNNGEYTLEISENANTIVYSFIGMETQEIEIDGRNVIDVQLEPAINELDEVVAIGYGTVRKRDLTGAVASVKSEEFEKAQSGNIFTAIQGKLSGVQINSQGGDPASGFNVVIRGASSITAGTAPLYVIDGIQFDINDAEVQVGDDAAGNGNPMAFLNPSDIESMEVLKDASATSIFGARGANGVIIITTKSSKEGMSSLNFDYSTGVTILKDEPFDVLSPQEYIDYKFRVEQDLNYGDDTNNDSIPDVPGSINDPRFSTYDYADELIRTGVQNNYNLSYRGSTKNTSVSASLAYSNAKLIVKNNTYERLSANLKATHKLNDKITLGSNFNYGNSTRDGVASDSEYNNFYGLFQKVYINRPVYLTNSEDGDADDEDVGNKLINQVYDDTKIRKQSRMLASVFANIDFTKKLSLRVEGNANISTSSLLQFKAKTGSGWKDGGRGTSIESNSGKYTFRSILNYSEKINNHRFKVLAGAEYSKYNYYSLKAEAMSFDLDVLGAYDLSFGQLQLPPVQQVYDNKMQSAFGRIDYNFNQKYYITANMRVDGSSKFGENNKVAYFPSVALSWRVKEESFLKSVDKISNLKLRASVGASGNDRLPDYMSLSNISNSGHNYAGVDGQILSGVAPSVLGNPDLKWETTTQYNAGLDLGLFNSRILIAADIFRKDTKDMLLRAKMPAHSGFLFQWQNVGSIRNEGWEFLLNTVNIKKKNFIWTSDININSNSSMVLDLGNTEYLETGGAMYFQNISRIQEGHSLNQIWGYDIERILQVDDFTWQNESDPSIAHEERSYELKEGYPQQLVLNPEPGDMYFKDISGPEGEKDGIVNSEYDKTYIGDATPDFYGGINNSFSYKQFDLSFFFKYSVGAELFYGLEYNLHNRVNNNRLKDYVDNRWTIDNPNTDYYKYPARNGNETVSYYVHDASYIKLQNITLAYTIPKKVTNKLKMNMVKFHVTANNLFMVTNYSGADPDVKSKGLFSGFDRSSFPTPVEIFAGVKISL